MEEVLVIKKEKRPKSAVDTWIAERYVRNELCLFPVFVTVFALAAGGAILMAVRVLSPV